MHIDELRLVLYFFVMSQIPANLSCPSCQHALRPAVLECPACRLRVEGSFQLNEFASLSPDELHLLRIFVLAEGRVRDMEAPLGLSYPTIRTRLAALRETIAKATPGAATEPPDETVDAVLDQLQRQELTFDEAMKRIKRLRGSTTTPPRRGRR
jgi:hypothetical protein